jgi:hypothetical protein
MQIYAGVSPYLKPRIRAARGVIVVTFLGLLVVAGSNAAPRNLTTTTSARGEVAAPVKAPVAATKVGCTCGGNAGTHSGGHPSGGGSAGGGGTILVGG